MAHQTIQKPAFLIFREIIKKHAQGTLYVISPNFSKELYFSEGTLTFAKTSLIQERIGEILFKIGKINARQFASIGSMITNSTERIGKVLVSQEIISQRDLFLALLYQIRTIALSVFNLSEGQWNFTPDFPELANDSRFSIELPAILSEGIKITQNTDYFRNQFLGKIVSTNPLPDALRPYLNAQEIYHHHQLSQIPNTPVEQWIEHHGSQSENALKQLALFFMLDLVSFKDNQAFQLQNQLAEQVLQLHETLTEKKHNNYQILGVEPKADFTQIKDAYFNLAKKFHPDRFTGLPDPEIRDKANHIFSLINQAYDTLSSNDKRQEYDTSLSNISTKHGKVEENLSERAAILYKKAITLYKGNKFWEASHLLEEAVRIKKDNAEYHLLLGLSQMVIPSLRHAAQQNLSRASELAPYNPEPQYGLGCLFMAEKMYNRAENFFRKAISIDPEHKRALKKLEELKQQGGKKKKNLWEILNKKI